MHNFTVKLGLMMRHKKDNNENIDISLPTTPKKRRRSYTLSPNEDNNIGTSLPSAPKKTRRSYMLFSFEKKNKISEPVNTDCFNYISGYVVRRKYNHLRSLLATDSQFQFESMKQFTSAVKTLKTEYDNITEKNNMVSQVVDILAPLIGSNLDYEDKIVICSVPTSTPNKSHLHGATMIAKELALVTKNIDGTDYIYRTAPKKPLHLGGKRTSEDALKNLMITSVGVRNKVVLLLDDVVKTGTSLNTIRDILLKKHGALRVVCLAVSRVFTNESATYDFKSYFDTQLQASIDTKLKPEQPGLFNTSNILKANNAIFFSNQPMALQHSTLRAPLNNIESKAKKRLEFTLT